MARNTFAGTLVAFAITAQDASAQYGAGALVAKLNPFQVVTFWDSPTGGTQLTDLLVNGVGATTVTTDAVGEIPQFSGPDGVTQMWADAGTTRRLISCNETSIAAATLGAGTPTPSTFLAGDLVWRTAPTGTVGTAVPQQPATTGNPGGSGNASAEDHIHPFGSTVARLSDLPVGTARFDVGNGQTMSIVQSTGVVSFGATTQQAPGPPTGLTAVTPQTNGSKSVTLTWVAPVLGANVPPLTDYNLYVTQQSNNLSIAVPNLVATDTSVVVSGLADNTTYTVALGAVNSVGSSPAATTTFTSDPAVVVAAVPSPPLNLNATTPGTSGSKSMTFTWSPPAQRNGTLSNYTATMTGTHGAIPTITPAMTSVTVTGLVDNTAYTFTLAANNATGASTAATVTATSDPATVVAGKMLIGFNLPGDAGPYKTYLQDVQDGAGGVGSETAAQWQARLIATFGQNQVSKTFSLRATGKWKYASGLSGLSDGSDTPTWDASHEGAMSPGKTILMHYYVDSVSVMKGLYDAPLKNYMASIPAGWTVYFGYGNEVDNDIGEIFPQTAPLWATKAQYVQAADYLATVIRNYRNQSPAPLAAGVKVYSLSSHMYYFIRNGSWPISNTSQDDRLPRKVDFQGMDVYLNPPPGDNAKATLYYIQNGLYEDATTNNSATFAANLKTLYGRVNDYTGLSYANRWIISEFNAPFRQQDVKVAGTNGSPTGTGRADGSVRADTFTNALVNFRAAGCQAISIWDQTTGRFPHRLIDMTTGSPSRYKDGSAWNPVASAVPNPNREPAIAAIRAQFGL